jgi:hypothetical protein
MRRETLQTFTVGGNQLRAEGWDEFEGIDGDDDGADVGLRLSERVKRES